MFRLPLHDMARGVPRRPVDGLDALLLTEALVLMVLVMVFVHDWMVYRRTGRLPWVVTCCDEYGRHGNGKGRCCAC